jgi:hypothetical protein
MEVVKSSRGPACAAAKPEGDGPVDSDGWAKGLLIGERDASSEGSGKVGKGAANAVVAACAARPGSKGEG